MTIQRCFSTFLAAFVVLILVSGCDHELKAINNLGAQLQIMKANADAAAAANNNMNAQNAAALAKLQASSKGLVNSLKSDEEAARAAFGFLVTRVLEAKGNRQISIDQINSRVGLGIVAGLQGSSPAEMLQMGMMFKRISAQSPSGPMAMDLAQSMVGQTPLGNDLMQQWGRSPYANTPNPVLASHNPFAETGSQLQAGSPASQSIVFTDSAKTELGVISPSELRKARGFGLKAATAGGDR